MPPDSSPPLPYHMTNQEIQKPLSQTVVSPSKMSEEMNRQMVEDLKEEFKKVQGESFATRYDRRPSALYSQYQEQKAFNDMQKSFNDMEQRLRSQMQTEVRKVEELVAFQMAMLDKKADDLKEKMETLVTALVEQNRELSRRVTDLEWEGINP